MKTYIVEVDGKPVKVLAEKLAGKLWFHMNGETRVYEPVSKYASGSSSKASATPGVIAAPMPGKIIKVSCSAGDSVTPGQVVVTMEAMKMEYSLEADIEGVVKTVNFKAGDQVTVGQEIVKIEASDG